MSRDELTLIRYVAGVLYAREKAIANYEFYNVCPEMGCLGTFKHEGEHFPRSNERIHEIAQQEIQQEKQHGYDRHPKYSERTRLNNLEQSANANCSFEE